jgi:hypothetical protein
MKDEAVSRYVSKEDHVLLFQLTGKPTLLSHHPFNMGIANAEWTRAAQRKRVNGRRFNGVTPGMWQSPDWYQYLEASGGRKMVEAYHPKAYLPVPYIDRYFCFGNRRQQSLYEFVFSVLTACGALAPRKAIASWDFSYEGQFSKLSAEDIHSDSDAVGPWLQLRFKTEGRIELIGVRPAYGKDEALLFKETATQLTSPISVYRFEQSNEALSIGCFGYHALKSFLDLTRHDLLRASVYFVENDASRPLLAIRSLNRPLLWVPMAQGRTLP